MAAYYYSVHLTSCVMRDTFFMLSENSKLKEFKRRNGNILFHFSDTSKKLHCMQL